jgi:hypothetical protein
LGLKKGDFGPLFLVNILIMFEIQLILENKFGIFVGRKATLTDEQYISLQNMAKTFYDNGGFELTLEDGEFVVFPPDVVKESILRIKKINTDV